MSNKNKLCDGRKDQTDIYFHLIPGYSHRSLNKRQISPVVAAVRKVLFFCVFFFFLFLCVRIRKPLSGYEWVYSLWHWNPNALTLTVILWPLQSYKHLQKHGPFLCAGAGTCRGFGGRRKAHEFQRVGSFARVGGDGVVLSFLWCVFPLCF